LRRYEGMFLIDSSRAARDWDGVVEHVKDILTRNGAEIVECKKWAERRLAYEIKHHKRGVYLLVHFDAPGPAIGRIRRECELSEILLRTLIVRFDPRAQIVSEEQPEPATTAEPSAEKAAESKPEAAEATAEAEKPAAAPAESASDAEKPAEETQAAQEAQPAEEPKTEEAPAAEQAVEVKEDARPEEGEQPVEEKKDGEPEQSVSDGESDS